MDKVSKIDRITLGFNCFYSLPKPSRVSQLLKEINITHDKFELPRLPPSIYELQAFDVNAVELSCFVEKQGFCDLMKKFPKLFCYILKAAEFYRISPSVKNKFL